MVEVTVLGIAQDGGHPQPGCLRPCCANLTEQHYPVSLGIRSDEGANILIEATRHLGDQFTVWGQTHVDHLLLTHAHFGHVDGLGLFGRETLSAQGVQLHVSEEMYHLVDQTPQWNLMVQQGVFEIQTFAVGSALFDQGSLKIEPVRIPHRDELSDMHAFILRGPNKSLLFLPDHDSWDETLTIHNCSTLRQWLSQMNIDIALLDGTFWSEDELGGRDQSKVPHPPVVQTLKMLGEKKLGDPDIFFTHLNHTNPLYDQDSEQMKQVSQLGWGVVHQGQRFTL
jgi:pyrroloquinoline quinone biosynthesis protein B|tara:strand:+ start:459 stop:1304 length:846 start_codon:yes stop_codon:yes gene_type:complete